MHSPSLRQAKQAMLKARGNSANSSPAVGVVAARGSAGSAGGARGAKAPAGPSALAAEAGDAGRFMQRFAEVFFAPAAWSSRYGEKFFTASIPGAETIREGGTITLYRILCKCGVQEWSVKRRYSEFAALWAAASAALRFQGPDAPAAPALPPKTPPWQDKNAPGVVAERRVALEAALQELFQLPGVTQLPAVRAFLAVPSADVV